MLAGGLSLGVTVLKCKDYSSAPSFLPRACSEQWVVSTVGLLVSEREQSDGLDLNSPVRRAS